MTMRKLQSSSIQILQRRSPGISVWQVF